jgi:N-acetylglucosamine-6-phosphate deacetylase
MTQAFIGFDILDGHGRRPDMAIQVMSGQITGLVARAKLSVEAQATATDLQTSDGNRALIFPGFTDVQANGGGGLMLGDCQNVHDLGMLAGAHRLLGTTHLLPTLISDTPAQIRRIGDLIAQVVTDPAQPIRGLHLEGPHLAVPGAHDPALLRPMNDADIALYLHLKGQMDHLMVTLAPEQASTAQVSQLAGAGITVSLGHTACDYAAALSYFEAGAQSATHLFNAMSGLHHRTPGLALAALEHAPFIGLIADGHHVHPAMMRLARQIAGDRLYLITDAMAVAQTDATEFTLQSRRVLRQNGCLRLQDGTLAGADVDLFEATTRMADAIAQPVEAVLAMGFDTPYRLLTGRARTISVGDRADLTCLSAGQIRPWPGRP